MWSLLFAVLADGRTARAQKAGLHELRQRLGVGTVVDRRPPPFTQQLLDWEEKLRPIPVQDGFHPIGPLYDIAVAVGQLAGQTRTVERPGLQELTEEVILPGEPILNGEEAYLRALRRRTPVDGLLAWVLREWERGELSLTFSLDVVEYLRAMRDWAEATGTDLTKLTWAGAVEGSNAWHRRFMTVGFGETPRPGLVVLRWPDGWTLHRLLDRASFADEGSSMGHCIGGPVRANGRPDGDGRYWKQSREDVGAVFSLRNPEGKSEATVSVVQNGYRGFLVEDVEGPRNTRLRPGVRLRLLSAYPALGMTEERVSMTGLVMDRSGMARAIRPEGGVDPETDSDYTGKPWVSLGAKTWREGTTKTAKESGLLLMLEAVRTFAQKMDEPLTAVGLRGVDHGFPHVHLVPTGPEPHPGWIRVRPHPSEDRGLIEVVFSSGVDPVVEYPTLYAAYLAASARPRVQPYTGLLYPDATPEQRKALTESPDISGGVAPGMGRRSSLRVALGLEEARPAPPVVPISLDEVEFGALDMNPGIG